ncbi:uncharacterized protein PV07_08708 [Cladophialophora immunda]|uniref:Uncharacterized protein n=1 Tax=Cladophialophora immunda TaxID=569365 RepID=A0A0D2AKQ7_9EURO|nr:uncharacterized protein PV07_08708 [Cladophialophora immunda]KIW25542.1 hypothetical protein PV07_08708 [Cladophialophora immunda]
MVLTARSATSNGLSNESLSTTLHPKIHYGTIGSAHAVVKDTALREKLRQTLALKGVEMEAAGLMDSFAYLVIRGISNYVDSRKKFIGLASIMASKATGLLLGLRGLAQIQEKYATLFDWTRDDDTRHDLEQKLFQHMFDVTG